MNKSSEEINTIKYWASFCYYVKKPIIFFIFLNFNFQVNYNKYLFQTKDIITCNDGINHMGKPMTVFHVGQNGHFFFLKF
jgi:hypothetical protein